MERTLGSSQVDYYIPAWPKENGMLKLQNHRNSTNITKNFIWGNEKKILTFQCLPVARLLN
jgi:hypothetical protein